MFVNTPASCRPALDHGRDLHRKAKRLSRSATLLDRHAGRRQALHFSIGVYTVMYHSEQDRPEEILGHFDQALRQLVDPDSDEYLEEMIRLMVRVPEFTRERIWKEIIQHSPYLRTMKRYAARFVDIWTGPHEPELHKELWHNAWIDRAKRKHCDKPLSYNPDQRFMPWLRRCIFHDLTRQFSILVRASVRAQRMRESLQHVGPPKPSAVSEEDIRRETLVALSDLLNKDILDTDDRRILMLRIVEGKTIREISSEVGFSPGKVHHRIQRAVRLLRKALRSHQQTPGELSDGNEAGSDETVGAIAD